MDNNNIDRKSFDEQRRKKAENFHLRTLWALRLPATKSRL